MSQTAQHVVLETLAYLATVDLTPILPKITTPALVLVAERSAMNTPDRAQGLAGRLPHGTLVEVPGASGTSSTRRRSSAWRSGGSSSGNFPAVPEAPRKARRRALE